jgi:hypothetical protein
LPFCEPPKDSERESHGLGEVLAGDNKVRTRYEVNFLSNIDWRRLCRRTLSAEDLRKFQIAVDEEYFFGMFYISLLPPFFLKKKQLTPHIPFF